MSLKSYVIVKQISKLGYRGSDFGKTNICKNIALKLNLSLVSAVFRKSTIAHVLNSNNLTAYDENNMGVTKSCEFGMAVDFKNNFSNFPVGCPAAKSTKHCGIFRDRTHSLSRRTPTEVYYIN